MTLRMNMVTVGMALMLVLELAISVAEEVVDLLTLFATQKLKHRSELQFLWPPSLHTTHKMILHTIHM